MSIQTLKFASLFSGCGGFDLGFINKGFVPQGAYDCDPEAVANFSKNVHSDIVCHDLTKGLSDINHLRNLDVLIAGPPCQGFSTAGKRLVNDPRNHLLTLTGEIALQLMPKVLVVENVFGALAGEHARYFDDLGTMMKEKGYKTATMRCQTANLGMSQLRRRVLMFAWKTKSDAVIEMPQLCPGILRSALKGVSKCKNHKPVNISQNSKEWKIANSIAQGQKLSNVRGGDHSVATWQIPEVFGEVTDAEITVLEMLRRLRRQRRQRDFGDADPVSTERLKSALGKPFKRHLNSLIRKGYIREVNDSYDLTGTFNGKFRRLSFDKPSCTVDTRFGCPRYFLHPTKNRGFTVREAARIQGFSDSYVFVGTEKSQFRVIGNSVPPPLAEFAADAVLSFLGRAS